MLPCVRAFGDMIMRLVFLGIALSLLTSPSFAQRPSTLGMTCGQANAVVQAQGSIVLSTGPHTFEKFTSIPGSCPRGERARRARAPTLDHPQCPLAYVCKPVFRDKKGF